MRARAGRIFIPHLCLANRGETTAICHQFLTDDKGHLYLSLNAYGLYLATRHGDFAQALSNANCVGIDGFSIFLLLQAMGIAVQEPVSGCDLLADLFTLAAARHERVFLLGAREHILEKTKNLLHDKYPDISIVSNAVDNAQLPLRCQEVINRIRLSNATMLFVSLDSPLAEIWLSQNLKKLGVRFAMSVGGSLEVFVGEASRAPLWMRRCGLEWLHRFYQEPRRRLKKTFISTFWFLGFAIKTLYLNSRFVHSKGSTDSPWT